jgi:hypothetical protein
MVRSHDDWPTRNDVLTLLRSVDLQNMGLWQPIVKHLTDTDDEIVKHACWVCGTAVQVR